MERLTTGMQHRPAMYTLGQTADCYSLYLSNDIHYYQRYAGCVHSTYHTPNKEIVMGRC